MNKEKLKAYGSYSGNAAVLVLSLTMIAFSIEAWKTALGLQSISAGGGEYLVFLIISLPAFIAVNIVHWLLVWALSRSYLHKTIRYVYWVANIFVIGLFMVDILKQV
ncbi:MAG: hypothetical protein R6V21_10160 [Pelovirga sp.]